ncbi:MAG: hypothetical protein ACTSYB_12600 [Candidatus Helarchaeota archaeon]
MILLIDTCTWFKLDLLTEENLFNSENLYELAEIEITHQVLKELEHFGSSSFQKERTKINPIRNQKIFNDVLELGFDEADASILSFGSKTKNFILVSEDNALLEYARVHGYFAIQLIDLFRLFTQKKIIKPRKLYHLTKKLRELKNITKKKEKEILKLRFQTNIE